jgi:hypothetical protein
VVRRFVTIATLAAVAIGSSGCAFHGRHGRVHVGVALPPIVIPIPRHEPQPEYPPAPAPAPTPAPLPPPPVEPAPPPAHGPYPSAGSPGPGAYVEYGSVRSIETSPYRGMVRVGVMLDSRAMRYFDLPGTNLRIGERVRVEGERIFR